MANSLAVSVTMLTPGAMRGRKRTPVEMKAYRAPFAFRVQKTPRWRDPPPQASRTVLTDCGHSLLEDAPDAWLQEVRRFVAASG